MKKMNKGVISKGIRQYGKLNLGGAFMKGQRGAVQSGVLRDSYGLVSPMVKSFAQPFFLS
jgi:hypothetical protein